MSAVEANVDALVGPTHNYAALAVGNLASQANFNKPSDPRAAALQGLAKMKRLADLGIPQFVLPPQSRPDLSFLRRLGFVGSDAEVNASAWRSAPAVASAAWSASAMWTANAATVTASIDSFDRRVHLTPANLLTNLHRSLEADPTTSALRHLLPDRGRFAVHDPLPAQPSFADEGAANHVRLCAEHGEPGVDLLVWGRTASEHAPAKFPARQTREACEAIARRHGIARPVFARQSAAAIQAGAFHNDVVCVGAKTCLLYHELAFEDPAAVRDDVRRAADGLFEPVFLEIAAADLSLTDAVRSYLFNTQLLQVPGEDRLMLLSPIETFETPAARKVVERIVNSNGPIGRVEYMDLRESMQNGGGPACLRLRIVVTEDELAAMPATQRLDETLYVDLCACVSRRYRDRLTASDLADPQMITESCAALEELQTILNCAPGPGSAS